MTKKLQFRNSSAEHLLVSITGKSVAADAEIAPGRTEIGMHLHREEPLKTNLGYFGIFLTFLFGALCQAQNSSYVYVSNESLSTVDVIRASDHVRIRDRH